MDYGERLKQIDITLISKYTKAKDHHTLQCDICSNIWIATPCSKLQNFKLYGYNGCPNCYTVRSTTVKHKQRQVTIETIEKQFNILSEYDGQQLTTTKITVQNKQCGHIFEAAPGNLLHRDVTCPTCNNEDKIKRLNQSNTERQDLYNLTASDWDKYRRSVYSLTRKAYIIHETTINPNNHPRGLAGQTDAYHLDHIVPIRWCFDNGVPSNKCAHHSNLRMVQWLDNIQKRDSLPNTQDVPDILTEYLTP